MNQKRFLTAAEVFQLFGVDAEALDRLVDSGDVKALADLGTFKYRAEDFANLVNAGKLTARTSGEMFHVDSKGDIPFLKIKDEDKAIKFDDDISFLELDEEALAEQAGNEPPAPSTPVTHDKWFDDIMDEDAPSKSPDKIPAAKSASDSNDDQTDFDFDIKLDSNTNKDSDSNVRIVDDGGGIDFDEPDVVSMGSDSDVRLEGPVSSPGSQPVRMQKKPGSDSDVRLAKSTSSKPKSDSDVTIAPTSKQAPAAAAGSTSDFSGIAQRADKKPESDSDVLLASPFGSESNEEPVSNVGSRDSDSDVVLVATPDDSNKLESVSASNLVRPDSDSDVQLVSSTDSAEPIAHAAANPKKDTGTSDSDVVFDVADSGISLEPVEKSHERGELAMHQGFPLDTLKMEASDPELSFDGSKTDNEIAIESAEPDSGITLDMHGTDSGITLDSSDSDSGISLQSSKTDSEIILESGEPDSGIALDPTNSDSGITLQSDRTDSDIALDPYQSDSGITLGTADPGSGISLEPENSDSSILFEHGDSGIRLSASDSGISFAEATDPGATFIDHDAIHADSDENDGSSTQTLDLSGEHLLDSGFDVSLHDGGQTIEMDLPDSQDELAAATKPAGKGRQKALSLSEAFKLDEPLEVEDLEITEDLASAPESEYSGEFAEADEEVLEASDDDFSAGEISVDEDSGGESDAFVPAAKVRALPREPEWGMGAIIPIGMASLVMAATVTVLWGGVATMWTGGEAPGPAGMLISALAGLIPS